MCEFGPLWLDDFGTGMANFSALSEVRYDYIKIARELFVMLRQSPVALVCPVDVWPILNMCHLPFGRFIVTSLPV